MNDNQEIEGSPSQILTDGDQLLSEMKENPIKVLEVGIGIASAGKIGIAKGLGRLAQAVIAGNGTEQFYKEFKKLQAKGTIKNDEEIKNHPYGEKSFVDLLKFIDSNPEKNLLEAVKALFFEMMRKDEEALNTAIAYRLFSIIQRMESSELITLISIQELTGEIMEEYQKTGRNNISINAGVWQKKIAEKQGHNFYDLIRHDVERLIELALLNPQIASNSFHPKNFKLNSLGEALYESVNSYQEMFHIDIN